MLQPSLTVLRTYTGETIPVLGTADLEVAYENKRYQLTTHISSGKAPNLLGRDWLQHAKLNWPKVVCVKQVAQQSRLEDILKKYSYVGLFNKELGAMRGVTTKIYMDPTVRPKYYKARPVPYALRPKLINHWIDCWQKVQFSQFSLLSGRHLSS